MNERANERNIRPGLGYQAPALAQTRTHTHTRTYSYIYEWLAYIYEWLICSKGGLPTIFIGIYVRNSTAQTRRKKNNKDEEKNTHTVGQKT